MNGNFMMLLPLLMAKNGGGISPDAIMNMFGGASPGQSTDSGGMNPMYAMMMAMLSGNRGKNVKPQSPDGNGNKLDADGLFGKDVMNMLRILMELNARKEKNQSGSV